MAVDSMCCILGMVNRGLVMCSNFLRSLKSRSILINFWQIDF